MPSPTGGAVSGQPSRCETQYAVGAKTLGGGLGRETPVLQLSLTVFNSSGGFPVKMSKKCDDHLRPPAPSCVSVLPY